jgi:hypothetical protein
LAQAKLLNDGIDGNLKMGYRVNVHKSSLIIYWSSKKLIRVDLTGLNCGYRPLLHPSRCQGFCALGGYKDCSNPYLKNLFSLVLPEVIRSIRQILKTSPNLRTSPLSVFRCLLQQFVLWNSDADFWRQRFPSAILHSTVNTRALSRLVENFGISIVPTSLQSGYNLDVKFVSWQR